MAKTPSKKAAKATKPVSTDKKKTRSHKRVETYHSYIYKVLKQVHPEKGISKKSISILNSFITDIFDRTLVEAGKLARYSSIIPTFTFASYQTESIMSKSLVSPFQVGTRFVMERFAR